jgi:hypothetical protein
LLFGFWGTAILILVPFFSLALLADARRAAERQMDRRAIPPLRPPSFPALRDWMTPGNRCISTSAPSTFLAFTAWMLIKYQVNEKTAIARNLRSSPL